MVSSDSRIVIIGGGTFGLSTALELLRVGQKNVTVIDPYPIPSPLSAGNDVNKVMQSILERKFYTDLAQESLRKWKNDPVYKPAFHETGIIYGGISEDAQSWALGRYNELKEAGRTDIELLEDAESFKKLVSSTGMDSLANGSDNRFSGWKGYFQKTQCGWTYAALALTRAAEECTRLGATFVTDSVEELVFNSAGDCTGVLTLSGETIPADRVVIAAGASSYKFLDYQGQLLAKCWTVGHIKLTRQELAALKGCPVVLNLDKGFFFEPDEFGDLKFCNEFPGYVNMKPFAKAGGKVSVPLFIDKVPKEAEEFMRDFLADVLPSLATREFNVAKICWCTDTPDRHFLIGEHPDHKNLILGTGDSGQGFKFMPIVGEYIAAVVLKGDAGLPKEKREAWKWRPETGVTRDNGALQGRAGGTNVVKDLQEIEEWTDGTLKSKL